MVKSIKACSTELTPFWRREQLMQLFKKLIKFLKISHIRPYEYDDDKYIL